MPLIALIETILYLDHLNDLIDDVREYGKTVPLRIYGLHHGSSIHPFFQAPSREYDLLMSTHSHWPTENILE